MELPVPSNSPALRNTHDIHALGKAVQANLVQLRVEATRRDGASSVLQELVVCSPGAITHHRAALIDRHVIRAYSDDELHLRLHEQWGAYGALCWVVRATGINGGHDFGGAPPDADMHCTASVEVKVAEVHAMLWRLRYELRLRRDAGYRDTIAAQRDAITAVRIPLVVQGRTPDQASDAQLYGAACEHAGMLATLRWAIRPAAHWSDVNLMALGDNPFP